MRRPRLHPVTSIDLARAMDEVANYSFDVLVQDEQLCLEGLLNDVAFGQYSSPFSSLHPDSPLIFLSQTFMIRILSVI